MKEHFKLSCFVLIVLATLENNYPVFVNSAALDGDHHHHDHQDHGSKDHVTHAGDHHEHGDETEPDLFSSELDFSEVSIKGYGEDCLDEDKVKCNDSEGLMCFKDLGKCDCNKNLGLVYSVDSGKCQEKPEPVNLAEEEDVKTEDDNKENKEEESSTTAATAVKSNSSSEDVTEHELRSLGVAEVTVEEKKVKKCENVNCTERLGQFSKCDEETGKCICHNVEQGIRSFREVRGKCLLDRKINDACEDHEQCKATIAGKAWCHLDFATMTRFCQCEMFHYFDDNLQECLPLARNGLFSPCKAHLQCTGSDKIGQGFGPNARCSLESGMCECKLGPDGQKGFLYDNYCYYQLKIGDACAIDNECEVALPNNDVVCSKETKTCSCKNEEVGCPKKTALTDEDDHFKTGGGVLDMMSGRKLHSDSGDQPSKKNGGAFDSLKSAMGLDVPNFVFVMIIAAVVILLVVIASVFIVRKRHKYTVVRSMDTTDPIN